ncbi:MAG: AmmeMemoRadiSam system radical SAM enzyme [Candidatus Eremiobacteraeota bacterium]|jgi:pyruvate formate lyase activating enzyme|nr:AmmeMemoRadiSam system radical SAM enzyme [Candidatus Eremiobacteraeota bacterium]MCL5056150.1 AmmeMemoRadiSam system radical SAM enzyme [Bacillota bacterium]
MAYASSSLKETLSLLSKEGELYEKLPDGKVICFACGHRCKILKGLPGICKVRFNQNGTLYVPFGYVGAIQLDPIEKKPFFHALPGNKALSFGMLGCDYHCSYCQNWVTSQALRDPAADAVAKPILITPREFINLALKQEAKVVTSTYNEPLITSEWAVEIFKEAKKEGLVTSYVSNGNGTPEVLEYIKPYVDLYKVDLKGFQDKNYRKLGGKLETVKTTIQKLVEKGFWVEVVTLVIPGFNDSEEELRNIARFLKGVSPYLPWHVTAFHKDYKMTDPEDTRAETLMKATSIGLEEGLFFVYPGNLPNEVKEYENTVCPFCKETLIRRIGYKILENRIQDGCCPDCHAIIPGVWLKKDGTLLKNLLKNQAHE